MFCTGRGGRLCAHGAGTACAPCSPVALHAPSMGASSMAYCLSSDESDRHVVAIQDIVTRSMLQTFYAQECPEDRERLPRDPRQEQRRSNRTGQTQPAYLPSGCTGYCATPSCPEHARLPKKWITPQFAAFQAVGVDAPPCFYGVSAHVKVTHAEERCQSSSSFRVWSG